MNFELSEEQDAIRGLARELLEDHCTPETLRAVEDSPTPGFDRALWAKLAEAGLLGICVAERHGGLGLGFLELALLLEEVGRTVAPVPVYGGIALGALPLSRYGTSDQQAVWLPGIVSGRAVVTAAIVEPMGDPLQPATTARREGDGWVLDGLKVCVPAGLSADRALVSAMTEAGSGLFLVDPEASGVEVQRQDTISYAPEALLALDGVRVGNDDVVGALDGSTLHDVVQLATASLCAVMTGVVSTAVQLTADYTKTREQFGHAIALFQAVGQRAADSFIDTTAIRLTTLQAVWRLSAGLPADKEVAVAKFFASEAGQRVVRAAAHLHGGMGASREYPLHRYYVWAKQLELSLGSGTPQLARLGRLLAEEPA